MIKTEGPADADIFLVGEAPGTQEELLGKPFVGYAGKTLNTLLQQAGISRSSCLVSNVARKKPPGNNISYFFLDSKCTIPTPEMDKWISLLKEEIQRFKPKVVVALGSTALWALTGEKNISRFRGFFLKPNFNCKTKILPTYHPQAVNYEWNLYWTVVRDLRKALLWSNTWEIPEDKRTLYANPSFKEFLDFLFFLEKENKTIAVDIETAQPGSHVSIIGIADSPERAFSFKILNGHDSVLTRQNEVLLWATLAKVFHKNPVVMHNGSYDASVLFWNNGIAFKNFFFDTMIAAHVLWPECPRSLGYCASICLNVPAWKHEAKELPTLYNAADAANTFGIFEVMQEALKQTGQMETFSFEMSQLEVAMMLQLQGIAVNEEKRKELLFRSQERISQLEAELEETLGKKINFSSPKQLQTLLYIDLGLPVQYKRRKSSEEEKKLTSDSEALKKLFLKTKNPVLEKILELKKLTKLTTNFLNISVSSEGKVHTCYNITGATMTRTSKQGVIDDEEGYKSFGRWSSSKSIILPYGSGNLQNIPKAAREIYTAPEGKVILQADYMQAEAVVVAWITGDTKLKDLFTFSFRKPKTFRDENGLDVHKLTAAVMFGLDIHNVTPEQRTIGKTIRHAVSYSAGPAVVATRLDCSVQEAKKLLQAYHNANPHLRLWHSRIQEELKRTKTLYNLFGRKHFFLNRWGDSLFRSAYSYIPQSTVGDLLNKALVSIYNNYGEEIDIILQLHDAIYFIVPQNEVKQWALKIRDLMSIPLFYKREKFFIDVDFSYGPSWGNQKELELN